MQKREDELHQWKHNGDLEGDLREKYYEIWMKQVIDWKIS